MKLLIVCLMFAVALCLGWTQASRADEAAEFKSAGPALTGAVQRNQVRLAIRCVESDDCYRIWGDDGKAWGAYQFHKARWVECGGDPDLWGNRIATDGTQDAVAHAAMLKYQINAIAKNKKLSEADCVAWMANYHNRGHGSLKRTKYVKRVFAEYLRRKIAFREPDRKGHIMPGSPTLPDRRGCRV